MLPGRAPRERSPGATRPAGRRSRADERRVVGIVHGEVGERVAAVEMARAIGARVAGEAQAILTLGSRIAAMLWRLG